MNLPVEQSFRCQVEFDVPRKEWLNRLGFDSIEAIIHSQSIGEPVDCPLEHEFLDGMYVRTIKMPAGSLVVSRIHKTRHKYVVMSGRVEVFIPGFGVQMIDGPYRGTTEPGTQRMLYCHTDVEWTTFHPNPDNEDLEQIEKRIIQDHFNPIIGANHSEVAHHRTHTSHVLQYAD